MLDFRRLAVLRTVSQHGSMSKAAATMTFTPSAVSQQIAALERQAGTPLVERTSRGVRLTDAGRLLVGHMDAVMDRLATAEAELAELLQLKAGRLRLASFSSAGSRLLPDAIAEFRQEYPGVELSLEIMDPAESAATLHSGRLDVAIVFDYEFMDVLDAGDLRRTPLCEDQIFLACSNKHRLAGHDVVDAAELRAEPWIQDSGTVCRELLNRLSSLAGFVPHVAFSSEDYVAVSRLVAAGIGVALIPGLAADQVVDGVALRPLRPGMSREVSVLTKPAPSPAASTMLDILLTSVQKRS
jgi:DNA-binding transcriptional LysR family regulator